MFFAAVVSLGLRFLLVWENSRLDRKYAPSFVPENGGNVGGRPDEKATTGGVEDYGPGFRYVL